MNEEYLMMRTADGGFALYSVYRTSGRQTGFQTVFEQRLNSLELENFEEYVEMADWITETEDEFLKKLNAYNAQGSAQSGTEIVE